MINEIIEIALGSIAEEMELNVGDKLISINGSIISDIIDYKYLIYDECLTLEIEKPNGEIWSLEIEKDYNEDIGIIFKNSLMDKARSCNNRCIFCFVDQLPKGLRETLYFKDDDSRLSFLQGNFVTLTNMKKEDIDRIIKYKISPINVSIHTTNPDLRIKMLGNPKAGDILNTIKKLTEGGIKINCQIVSCPEINNGVALINTIEDLYKFYPSIKNVAVVPVGLTSFRTNLFNLTGYDMETAKEELLQVRILQNKYILESKEPFVRLSDEFYVLAKEDVPKASFYKDFEQLEDGIGMIRMLRQNVKSSINKLNLNSSGSFLFVTGKSAYEELINVSKAISTKNKEINIKVLLVNNYFFGESITVAGLITGSDILKALGKDIPYQHIIIPENMLKYGERIFLDDMSIDEVSKILGKDILICNYTGKDLIDLINKNCKEVH
ncbi:MAG TPA: DUF512 domain-containing protein [Clostridiaceae bacterium]